MGPLGVWEEFRAFAFKGNVLDLAIAVIIGVAFTAVVTALVADIITPLIGIFLKVDFSKWNLTVNGSVFSTGLFINAVVSFVIVALVVFFGIVRPVAHMEARRKAKMPAAAPTTRECPECLSQVPIKARRCMNCTQPLPAA